MIEKVVQIDGKDVRFRASAGVPRLYRHKFGRDIMQDLAKLQEAFTRRVDDGAPLDIPSLEIFENVAYIMAKYADPGLPDSPDEWLEGFNTFAIYEVLPEIMDLWVTNMQTQVDAKKNLERVIGR